MDLVSWIRDAFQNVSAATAIVVVVSLVRITELVTGTTDDSWTYGS